MSAATLPCRAGDASADAVPPERTYEVWAGADVAEDVWLLYSGTTYSPFGDINKDGLRLRVVGGYGQYSYAGDRIALNPDYDGISGEPTVSTYKTFQGKVQFLEALIGYQWRFGELTTKAFVGIASIEHVVSPNDSLILPVDFADPGAGVTVIPFNRAVGLEVGFKGAVEFWLNMGADAYGSLDLSWSEAHVTRAARARVGHYILKETLPGLSAGAEASFNLNRNGEARLKDSTLVNELPLDYARVGGFVRYASESGEFSVSAGLVGDFIADQSAYGTANWISKF